ncbi:C-type mannose receptor 2-like [Macrobrachium rosenbergii]|uniref:C-type mannose receptor 2-like n=1 Tax=Macrobrachium rosenbergii TaxID=79674 RepID=UPI0034D5315B
MERAAYLLWLFLAFASAAPNSETSPYYTTWPTTDTTWPRTDTTPYETTTPGSRCTDIFEEVGDHCIFVDESLSGSWQDMRDVCHVLGGDLPNLQDANFLADIKDYLNNHGYTGPSYWVGSNDQITEGVWQWVNDHSQVKLGTPLWGDLSDRHQQPTGGSAENCGVLLSGDHYFMHDESCGLSHSLICEQYHFQGTEAEQADISKTDVVKPVTQMSCPSPYVIVAGKCIFVNTLAETSWESHKTSCESLGGHMIKLNDANELGAVFDSTKLSGVAHNFWIGATDDHQEGQWFWHDGSRVREGTPFWGDYGTSSQNPRGGVLENCGMITASDHYFFDDEDCGAAHYVICETDMM